jgi:hypothetical protein
LNERIGWKTRCEGPDKLTIEELRGYNMANHFRSVDTAKESKVPTRALSGLKALVNRVKKVALTIGTNF